MHDDLRRQIEELPDSPGIYVFRGEAGEALYVGKAKSLRKRVPSYLGKDLEPRLAAMVELAVKVECVATATEAAALMLENNWIKRHRPRYNVLLRDDKTYPYLKLTREPWPRLVFTRRIRQDGADYFGPLPARRHGAAGIEARPEAVRRARLLDRDRRRPAAALPLPRHEALPGTVRRRLDHGRRLRRGRRRCAPFPRRKDRAALPHASRPDGSGGGEPRVRARRPAARPAAGDRTPVDAFAALVGARGGHRPLRRGGAREPGGGVDPRHAVGAGPRPARGLLGRRERREPAATALGAPAPDLRPDDLSAQGAPSSRSRSTARRRWPTGCRSARGSGSTFAIPSAVRRRSACGSPPRTPSSPFAGAFASIRHAMPRRARWHATWVSRSHRVGSRVSTSRTCRGPPSSLPWSCGGRAASAKGSTAASTSAASSGRTISGRSARRSSAVTAGSARSRESCRIWC